MVTDPIYKKINATTDQFNKKFDYYYGIAYKNAYERNYEPKDFGAYSYWGDIHGYTDDKITGKYVIALIRYRMDGIDTSNEHWAFAKTWEYFVKHPAKKTIAKKPIAKKKVAKKTVAPKKSSGKKAKSS